MARRGVRLTDAQWATIEPLLPRLPRTRRGGRPWIGNRAVIDGILWVLKTGARWCDLPSEYPSRSTCWRRLKRWDEDGTWLRIWRALIAELDARGRLQWETAFIDGTFVSAKNTCLGSQWSRHGGGVQIVSVFTIALMIVSNLCIAAIKATFGAFPARRRRW